MTDADRPDPVPASKLAAGDEHGGQQLWGPYIRKGHKTLLAAHPKLGKTTLLAHVLALMAEGGEFVGPVAPSKVLVVSEESESLWAERRDRLSLQDNVEFLLRSAAWGSPWPDLCMWIGVLAPIRKYDLVVVDTLGYFAALEDENDAAEVQQAMKAIDGVVEFGCAVVLSHHKRKSEGRHGLGIRGSSAFVGSADIVLELERSRNGRRRRSLRCLSRFDDVEDVEVELAADNKTYRMVDFHKGLVEILPPEPPGLTVRALRSMWPDGPPPSESHLSKILALGVQADRWQRSGKGSKADPHRYWRPPP